MSLGNGRSMKALKDIWISLLDENNMRNYSEDEAYQGLLMLLETALIKTKTISSYYSDLKSSNEITLVELKEKSDCISHLKAEILRLENLPCQKCLSLEVELKNLRKEAYEAQSRMKSIANILRLGESIENSQSPRKNSAFNLVSQMLLEESPRRKKRCNSKISNTWKESSLNDDIANAITIVPDSPSPPICPNLGALSKVISNNEELVTSPINSISVEKPNSSCHKLTTNLKSLSQASPSRAKRNLNSSFTNDSTKSPKHSVRMVPETEPNAVDLNGSLADYVREANSELDKIWFTASSSKALDISLNKDEKNEDPIIEVTPDRTPQKKKKPQWKLKEVRGPSEYAGSKKVRQMTLSLGHKQKAKDVDVSTLSGFDSGALVSNDEPSTSGIKPLLDNKANTGSKGGNDVLFTEIDESGFKPKATSTQNIDPSLVSRKDTKEESPKYKYKRDTVRKKSERAKLEGWDCDHCAEYYRACGETSPSKVKGRMNKCSRHRDKFKPDANTPPGYWNPIFPDTQECREQGMYVSFHCKKNERNDL